MATLGEWYQTAKHDIHQLWENNKELLPSGYSILYSPLPEQADLVIVGYNPGGNSTDFDVENAGSIPTEHEYLNESYPLAKKMRQLFEESGHLELLKKSVKTNLIYFRSRDVKSWESIPKDIRTTLETRSIAATTSLVRQLKPKWIVCEGFATYDRLCEQLLVSKDKNQNINSAVRVSSITGGPLIIGLKHPTGARWSSSEKNETLKWFKSYL